MISERRKAELEAALQAHPELIPVMVTVTFEHHRGERLSDLLGALKEGLRFIRAGRGWQAVKDGLQLAGSVTGTEITWSERAGWHPHSHWLLLCRVDPDPEALEELKAFVRDRLQAFCDRSEGGRWVHPDHGVNVQAGGAALGSYIAKGWGIAAELAKSNSKVARSEAGRSPWGLLEAASEGDELAGLLFIEYASATFRTKLLTYSRGLKALLGVGEVADDQLALIDQGSVVVLASLSPDQWRAICGNDVRGELLEVACGGDPAAVMMFVRQFWDDPGGAGVSHPGGVA